MPPEPFEKAHLKLAEIVWSPKSTALPAVAMFTYSIALFKLGVGPP